MKKGVYTQHTRDTQGIDPKEESMSPREEEGGKSVGDKKGCRSS